MEIFTKKSIMMFLLQIEYGFIYTSSLKQTTKYKLLSSDCNNTNSYVHMSSENNDCINEKRRRKINKYKKPTFLKTVLQRNHYNTNNKRYQELAYPEENTLKNKIKENPITNKDLDLSRYKSKIKNFEFQKEEIYKENKISNKIIDFLKMLKGLIIRKKKYIFFDDYETSSFDFFRKYNYYEKQNKEIIEEACKTKINQACCKEMLEIIESIRIEIVKFGKIYVKYIKSNKMKFNEQNLQKNLINNNKMFKNFVNNFLDLHIPSKEYKEKIIGLLKKASVKNLSESEKASLFLYHIRYYFCFCETYLTLFINKETVEHYFVSLYMIKKYNFDELEMKYIYYKYYRDSLFQDY